MEKIRTMIYEKILESEKRLKETKVIQINEIKENNNILRSYNKLYNKTFIGGQYEWLGRLSKEIGELELCVHKDDKAHYFLEKNVKCEKDINGDFYIIDKEKSDGDIANVFENFKFPILEYTKVQMMEEIKEKGFYEIMLNTWFCHNPKNGKPCGMCNPCTYTIEEGMGFRLEKLARFKNRFYRIERKIKNALREKM